MNDDRAKTPRTLLVADHLWDAFAAMAAEMGSDRDALINQALYTFARLNGYLVPSDLKRMSSIPPPPAGLPSERHGASPGGRPPPTAQISPEEARSMRPPANAERVAELAQQLGSASNPPPRQSFPPPPVAAKGEGSIQVDDSLLGDEGRQATSMDLPNMADLGLLPRKAPPLSAAPGRATPEMPQLPASAPAPGTGGGHTLVLLADGRELDRIEKDRFLIGRGKHCDLIINSGKVSREHAAITREGSEYFIEDLGSSNGTWHDKRRITRRQIQEGDEYFICAEKLGCTFR